LVAALFALFALLPALASAQVTITNVTTPLVNGNYASGYTIPIEVTFSAVVDVTGKPRFLLETGAVDRFARYSTGTGSNKLTFYYIVLDNDFSTDLSYTSPTIDLVGGSITSASGTVNLTLPTPGQAGSLNFNKDIAVDGSTAGDSVNLCNWTQQGNQASGNWQVSAQCDSVLQTVNGDPTFFVSDFDLSEASFEGQFRTSDGGDDDMMGFVFGWQNINNFYVFDWKAATQFVSQYSGGQYGDGTAYRAARIMRVNGGVQPGWSLASLWTGQGDFVTTLAESQGVGWQVNVDYRYRLTFNPGLLRVEIFVVSTNTKIYDLQVADNTFTTGKIGFYNYSQALVNYSGFSSKYAPPPMFPQASRQGQTLDVVFAGTGFTPQTTVDFGSPDVVVTSTTFLNDRTVVATVQIAPTAVLGQRTVVVTTGGVPTTLQQKFTVNGEVNNVASITGMSPAQLLPGGTYSVQLSGNNFANDATVSMGFDVQVLGFTVNADNLITVSARPLPTSTGGSRTAVVNSVFSGQSTRAYNIARIDTVTQSTNIAGQSGVGTLTGVGFPSNAQISIGPLVNITGVTVVSPTQLTFNYTISPVAACGNLTVTLTDGIGTATRANAFEIFDSDAGPPELPAGVSGCNMAMGASNNAYLWCTGPQAAWQDQQNRCTSWGGYLVQVGSAAEQARLGALMNLANRWTGLNDIAVEGSFVWAGVNQPLGSYTNWAANEPTAGTGSNCVTFASSGFWDAAPCASTPFRTMLCEKDAASAGAAGVVPQVFPSVLGSGSTTQVTFRGILPVCTGSTAAISGAAGGVTISNCAVANANDVVCTVTVTGSATAGIRDVTFTSTAPVAVPSVLVREALSIFTVSGITPGNMTQGQTRNFTITGSGFVAGATVAFETGGVTVNSVTVVGPGQINISATAAANAQLGPYDVRITNGSGSPAVLANAVTVQSPAGTTPPPTITQVIPNTASPGQSVLATVNGSNFTLSTTATFGAGITVASCTTFTANTMQCALQIDANAALGPRTVQVTTEYGSAQLAGGFNVSAFLLSSVTPNIGAVGSTVNVTINGFGFTNNLVVTFGGADVAVSNFVVNNETTATATLTISLGATPGPRTVFGAQAGDISSIVGGFTVDLGGPVVTSVTPGIVAPGSTQAVLIAGGNLVPNAVFAASGGTLSNVSYVSLTQASGTFVAPATPQAINLQVTTGAGTNTLPNAIRVYGITFVGAVAVKAGASGSITLQGVGFQGDEVVTFGSGITVTGTTLVGNALQVTFNVSATAALGPYPTALSSPSLGLGHGSPDGITVLPPGDFVPPDPTVPPGCTAVFYQFKPYALCPGPATVTAADSACSSVGMHLIKIDYSAENSWLGGQLSTANYQSAWIGAFDVPTDGTYNWRDGSLLGYTAWGPGEPTEPYAFISGTTWGTDPASVERSFVCEGALPAAPPLVLLYRQNDGEGNQLADSSGNDLTGELTGDYTWVPSSLGGAAVQLNAGAAQGSVPFTFGDEATIELYADLTNGPAGKGFSSTLTVLGGSPAVSGFFLRGAAVGGDFVVEAGLGAETVCTGTLVAPNDWHHLAVTLEAGVFKLYLSGNPVPVCTGTHSSGAFALGEGPFAFVLSSASGATITTDNAALWSIALTPDDIEDNGGGDGPGGLPTPAVNSVTPSDIGPGQTRTVAVAGLNFATNMSLDFGPDLTVTSLTVNSAVSATATVMASPSAPRGFRTVRATTSYGKAALPQTFRVYGLTSVAPAVLQVGVANQAIQFSGYGLSAADNFNLGAGITVANVVCPSTRVCTASVSVSAGLPFGSRTVVATSAQGAVHTFGGILTLAGPDVIVWTTRDDFYTAAGSNVDFITKPGSVFLAEDTGERVCTFGVLCPDYTQNPGVGGVTFSYGVVGVTINGYSGGNVSVRAPQGEYDINARARVDLLLGNELQLFGWTANVSFGVGARHTQFTPTTGVYVRKASATMVNVYLYKRDAAGQTRWWNGTAWTAATTSLGLFPTGSVFDLHVENRVTKRWVLSIGPTTLANATAPEHFEGGRFFVGTGAELSSTGEPQDGRIISNLLEVVDPANADDSFVGALANIGWNTDFAFPFTYGGGTLGPNQGIEAPSVTGGEFLSLPLPGSSQVTSWTRTARVQVLASGGTSREVPLLGLSQDNTPDSNWQFGLAEGLFYDSVAGTLGWWRSDTMLLEYWNGSSWVAGPSAVPVSIPGTSGLEGQWIEVVITQTPVGREVRVFDQEGVLLTYIDQDPASGYLHFFLGSPYLVDSNLQPNTASLRFDTVSGRGSIEGAGFRREGIFAPQVYDAGAGVQVNWGQVGLGASLAAGTQVRLQFRAANSIGGLLGSPFVGPDGTPDTYFVGGETLGAMFDNTRYLGWRGTLFTGVPTESPELLDVIIPIQPLPGVTSVSPQWGHRGQTLDVTVNGNAFDSTSVVSLGTDIVTNSTTVLSATQLVVNVTMPSTNNPGLRNVTLTSAGGNASLPNGFALAGILTLSPPSIVQGATEGATVTGIGLDPDALLNLGPGVVVGPPTLTGTGSFTAQITAAADALLGPRDAVLGMFGFTTWLPNGFTVLPANGDDTLSIASVLPRVIDADSPAALTIAGAGFTPNLTATAGGLTLSNFALLGANDATVTAAVNVKNPGGSTHTLILDSGAQQAQMDIYALGIASTTAPQIAVGTTGVLSAAGVGFDDGVAPPSAFVGADLSLAVTSFDNSSLMMDVTVPANTPLGTRDLTVTVGIAEETYNDAFTIVGDSESNNPILTALTPNQGLRGQVISVTASGQNFAFGMSLNCGVGIQITNIVPVSNTQATMTFAIAPGATLGLRTCQLTTEFGVATLPNGFKVLDTLCDDVVCNNPPTACHEAIGDCNLANGTCSYDQLPVGAPCDDGIGCTVGGCNAQAVCGAPSNAACNDGHACTTDVCDPANGDPSSGCVHTSNNPLCNAANCPTGGDLNGNGILNVSDVMCLLLVSIASSPAEYPTCLVGPAALADMNCNESVNVGDIQVLVTITLTNALPASIDRNVNVCHDTCDTPDCADGLCLGNETCLLCSDDCGGCAGDCATVHATAGCSNPNVQECVCSLSPACCLSTGAWTNNCVNIAVNSCGAPPPP
jgi:hypothetical protein